MNKINAAKMVRNIRDEIYQKTKEKSDEELKTYFHQEAEAGKAEARELVKKEPVKSQ